MVGARWGLFREAVLRQRFRTSGTDSWCVGAELVINSRG